MHVTAAGPSTVARWLITAKGMKAATASVTPGKPPGFRLDFPPSYRRHPPVRIRRQTPVAKPGRTGRVGFPPRACLIILIIHRNAPPRRYLLD